MKKEKRAKGWLANKLSDPQFRRGYQHEARRLAIAEEIVRLRKKAGLTQSQLAMKIGTTASAISRYENADYDRYEVQTLFKIAQACGGSLKISFQGPTKESKAA